MGGEGVIWGLLGGTWVSVWWPVKGSSWSLSRSFGKPLGVFWGLLGSVGESVCGSKLDFSNILK